MRRTRTRTLPARFLLLGLLAPACASTGQATPSSSNSGGRWLIVTDDESTDPIRMTALQAAKDVGRSITERLHLPRDITIRLDSCEDGAPRPADDGSEVLLCDEAVRDVANALKRVPVVDELAHAEDAGDALLSVTRFLLAQQLGYALVDQLLPQAPTPSVGEADEFAALFLLGDPRLSHDVSSAAQVLPFIGAVPNEALALRAGETADSTASNVATARVESLRCLSEGATANTSTACRERLTASLSVWQRRLPTVRLR